MPRQSNTMNFEQYFDAKKRQRALLQNEKYPITDFCKFLSNKNGNKTNEREGMKGEGIQLLDLYNTKLCLQCFCSYQHFSGTCILAISPGFAPSP